MLEHQCNVGLFLQKTFDLLADDGILAIVVPTHTRDRLVAGNVTSWSIPLLCYNLVMAGFDCSEAVILDSYELSLIVKKRKAEHYELNKQFAYGVGEDEELFSHIKQYFPFEIVGSPEVKGPGQINWGASITDYFLPKLDGDKKLEEVNIVCKNYNSESPYSPSFFNRDSFK